MKNTIAIIALLLFSMIASAQTFGVRAGANYGKINGPTSSPETYNYNNGFHFGISYAYNISDIFSVRAELGYFQTGYKYKYSGESFYLIRKADNTVYEKGNLEMTMENSLGYLSIPVVANIKVNEKIHVHAGGYVNLLVSPTGEGVLRFESSSRPDDITFRQGLDYAYNSDGYFGQANKRYASFFSSNPIVRVGEDNVTIPRFAKAYYQYDADNKKGNYFNNVDVGLTAGFEYFITRGFFVGLSADYGLIDVTNNDMDYDRTTLNDDNSFKYTNDNDRQITYKLSLGFRF